MGKSKGRVRIERGLARMGLMHPPPAEPWQRPPAEECTTELVETPLDDTNVLKIRQVWHGKQLVDFAITHLTAEDGVWSTVARVDCCHGEFHRHQYGRGDGEKDLSRHSLRPIQCPEDVGESYDRAAAFMYDDYLEHLRRWSVGKR